jgi:hypothetical protein
MYARIATFEADPARADEAIAAARQQAESNWANPPEGLGTAKDLYLLIDREHGRGLGITLWETEEDLQRGNEALNQMTPPAQGGRRTDVAIYEVALHKQR